MRAALFNTLAMLMFAAATCVPAHAQDAAAKSGYFTTGDGVRIHYLTLGKRGTWVVLIHGYSDDAERMWFKTGIAQALAVRHRVVALDNRNHGLSGKPQPHGLGRAEDVLELMDHLHIEKAHIHGYSMGGWMMARLMATHPERFITAAFGGSGVTESDRQLRTEAAALDPPMPEPQGEAAEAFKRARESYEALKRAVGPDKLRAGPHLVIDLKTIKFPVLAINGEYDRPYSKTQRLWRELNNFQNVILPGKNHMTAAMVGGPMPSEYINALTRFIDANDPKQ